MRGPTPDTSARIELADRTIIAYHDLGSGPVLLLIHGGAPGATGWGNFGPVAEMLSEQFRTLVVDLPGYGDSPAVDLSAGRYASYARVFSEFLQELGIDRAHVLGMATGGAAAISMAVTAPDRVDRLVLVSSAGGLPLFSVMPSEGQKHIQGYYSGDGPSRERMRAYLEMMLYDKSLVTDELIEERYQASLDRVGEAALGPRKPHNEDVWLDLARIDARTLVMWGRDNRVQGYDNALFMLKQIPDVEVHLFGKTGLWIPFERPRQFVRQLVGFLQED